jgi:hypothetical protein
MLSTEWLSKTFSSTVGSSLSSDEFGKIPYQLLRAHFPLSFARPLHILS